MISIDVSYQKPLRQLIDFKITFIAKTDNSTLSFASWRPGRYEIANFSKNLQLPSSSHNFQKTDKDTFQFENKSGDQLTFSYQYWAGKMDAGNSWLDDQQLYINFINCIPLINEQQNDEIKVNVPINKGEQVACALPCVNGILTALSYDELVDSPIIISKSLQKQSYEVAGTQFYVWICSEEKVDYWDKLIADFKKFTEVQCDLFGGFPNDEFDFLIQALPYKHYHGVEHKNSTVITLGPVNEIDKTLYNELLGVASHELFHCWNVTRIRPKEMLPYDFSKETYHATGYVTEGLTTYYGDLMLGRSSVLSLDEYKIELEKIIQRHFDNPGRNKKTLTESSWDLWLNGYLAGPPFNKVSIYIKGALCALILDLKIRQITSNEKSLDDVLKLMWEKHGKLSKGYTAEDYQAIVEEVLGGEFNLYFDLFIKGKVCIERALKDAFRHIGVELNTEFNENEFTAKYGAKINADNKVVCIAENSPAESQIMVGDEIIDSDKQVIKRNGKVVNLDLKTTEEAYFSKYALTFPKQNDNFDNWINR